MIGKAVNNMIHGNQSSSQPATTVSILNMTESAIPTIFCLKWGLEHETLLTIPIVSLLYKFVQTREKINDPEQDISPETREKLCATLNMILDAYPDFITGRSDYSIVNVIERLVSVRIHLREPIVDAVTLVLQLEGGKQAKSIIDALSVKAYCKELSTEPAARYRFYLPLSLGGLVDVLRTLKSVMASREGALIHKGILNALAYKDKNLAYIVDDLVGGSSLNLYTRSDGF